MTGTIEIIVVSLLGGLIAGMYTLTGFFLLIGTFLILKCALTYLGRGLLLLLGMIHYWWQRLN